MPAATKLRLFLNGLTVGDLRAVRRRFAQDIEPYSKRRDKKKFVDSLWSSISGAIDRDELSFDEFTRFVVRDAKTRDRRNNTTIIEATLENIVFSRHLMRGNARNVRENWICGEVFQALRIAFDKRDDTKVTLERQFQKCPVDVCVTVGSSHTSSVKHYPIEVKRASEIKSMRRLPRQLDKYRKYVSPGPEKIYVLAVSEVSGSLNKKPVRYILNGARRRTDTKVIEKKSSCIR